MKCHKESNEAVGMEFNLNPSDIMPLEEDDDDWGQDYTEEISEENLSSERVNYNLGLDQDLKQHETIAVSYSS